MQTSGNVTDVHPCARCGVSQHENDLIYLEREDDFVCMNCLARSEEAARRAVVRKVNTVNLLASLRKSRR